MHGDEIRRRAKAGVVVVAGRGFAIRALGLLGTLVLAKILTPRDFGLVALGLGITVYAESVADGGIGAGLIRERDTPERTQLEAVLGFQLLIAVLLSVGTVLVALVLGASALVVAVMVAAM